MRLIWAPAIRIGRDEPRANILWSMPRSSKGRARLGLMTFHALFAPEVEHVIEYEQTADLIIYAETSEPAEPDADDLDDDGE